METHEEFLSRYRRYVSGRITFVIICLAIQLVAVVLNVSVGMYNISVADSYRVLIDHIMGIPPESTLEDMIIWDQRLPRAIGAVGVGMVLGVCGAAMQSSLKNPLADPYTTGISSGAMLGVALTVIIGINLFPTDSYQLQTILNAFLFSLIPAAVIIAVTRRRRATPTLMILTGVAVMYLFTAMTSMVMLLADPDDLAEVYRWNLGNLGSVSWDNLGLIWVAVVIAIVSMMAYSDKLNILSVDDESAQSIGVDPKKTRTIILIIVSIVTATAVSFTGSIGFVGLVAPHIVRVIFGSNNRYLIPASAAFGGMFLLLADTAAKVGIGIGHADVPVGIVTALVGGPLFLLILMRQNKNQWR